MDSERWQRVEQLYHSALEQPPADREAFLAAACARDAGLQQQVEILLAQSSPTETLVDKRAWQAATELTCSRAILEPGVRLGPYEIVALLGYGGMGSVYRAIDTRLDRAVAIKVSAEQLSARFDHEARAVSALNHPNISTLHDVGPNFLVMELVDGETLGERIARLGPLPVKEVLDVGQQVAEALEMAHSKGIIHCDLKPSNIKITSEGRVKVLDFGLASAIRDDRSGLAEVAQLTEAGPVLGTPAYMSPEQARGDPIDARTDVWSFGCLLYELLTQRHAFQGETSSEVITAIWEREPDWQALPSAVPSRLRNLIRQCLQKDVSRRRCDFAAIRTALENTKRTRTRLAYRVATLALLIGAAIAAVTWWDGARRKPTFHLSDFVQLTDQPSPKLYPSLSPNGTFFVYQSRASGKWDIYLQRVGEKTPVNLSKGSSDDNSQPVFSPDGGRIAFRSERDGGGVMIMGARGENPKQVTRFGYNPSWSPDGAKIVFSTTGFTTPEYVPRGGPLAIVDLANNSIHEIEGTGDAFQPSWSPHGQRIAYWSRRGGGNPQRDIWTVASTGGQPVEVTNDPATDWNPVWSPDGRYLYFSSDRSGTRNLWRVPIDEGSGKVQGAFEPVTTPSPFSWLMSFSRDGSRMIYVQQSRTSNIYRIGFDPANEKVTGEPTSVTQGTRDAWLPDISPDGQWVAFATAGKLENIFVIRSNGAELRQLTNDMYQNRGPRWSPDGKQIGFYSNRTGKFQIWTIQPGGSGLRQVTDGPLALQGPYWSPTGNQFAAFQAFPAETFVVRTSSLDEKTVPHHLPPLRQEGSQFWPSSWSPDGRYLAGYKIIAGNFAGVAIYSFESGRYQTATEFGHAPIWLADSRRLLFNHNGKLYLFNTATKRLRQLLSVPTGEINPWVFGVDRDNHQIVLSIANTESDIWQMIIK
jgi:serine/threonine protein kinase